jgi:hypothetical protein
MKSVKLCLIAAALCAFSAGSLIAQSTSNTTPAPSNTSGAGPGVHDPNHPRVNQINQREQNQQNRIANGIKNDKLTSRQTTNLERRETKLQNNEKKDMAADNGHLTKQNQRQLNHEANRVSGSIAKDKSGK